jgi:hypothetical protein
MLGEPIACGDRILVREGPVFDRTSETRLPEAMDLNPAITLRKWLRATFTTRLNLMLSRILGMRPKLPTTRVPFLPPAEFDT